MDLTDGQDSRNVVDVDVDRRFGRIEGLGDLVSVLDGANPKERAKVYANLGVTLTYRPEEGLVDVQAVPVAACAYERVGGGITPIRTRVLRGVIDLKAA